MRRITIDIADLDDEAADAIVASIEADLSENRFWEEYGGPFDVARIRHTEVDD